MIPGDFPFHKTIDCFCNVYWLWEFSELTVTFFFCRKDEAAVVWRGLKPVAFSLRDMGKRVSEEGKHM